MIYTADERAIIWLCACTDLDDRTRVALLRAAESPADLLEKFQEIAKSVIQERGNRLYNSNRSVREREVDRFLQKLEDRDRFIVTFVSDDYPEELKHIYLPPLMLYGEGNRVLLEKK